MILLTCFLRKQRGLGSCELFMRLNRPFGTVTDHTDIIGISNKHH